MANDCPEHNHCPVFYAVSRLGDKWSLLIIRDLMFFGKRHYGEFLNSSEGISTNILANRLERLEKDGLVSKREDPDNRSRYYYGLTEKGLALMPVLLEIVNWSATHDDETAAPAHFIRALREDRPGLERRLRQLYEQGTPMLDALED